MAVRELIHESDDNLVTLGEQFAKWPRRGDGGTVIVVVPIMFTGSISLGRLAGASLRIHWSAILVATLLAIGTGDERVRTRRPGRPPSVSSPSSPRSSATSSPTRCVARRFGVATTSIDLWALGGVARLEHEPTTPRAEGWIAAAGPLASIVIGVVAYGTAFVGFRLDAPDTVVTLLGWLGIVNVALGVFNLLPGAPLDGGRIVRAIRWAGTATVTGRCARPARRAG